MNASPDAVPQLSKEAINELPMLAYEGEVLLVQTEGELSRALNSLRGETLLGFDTESRPSFKKGKVYPTSLVQLAGSKLVVLIRLNHVGFTEPLAALLADPGVIKAGVAIRDDMRSLQKLHDFTPAGLADLADMAKKRGIKAQGLRTLAAHLMGGRISKAAQCSNWAKKTLTPQQVRYAATDAWIGRELYLRMVDD
uniref:3'-5' exonuclease n=1 Tax=uncultured Bilophila sp. TaxID=529385 RepID=UPI0025D85A67|nr:3'-5' exonuclease [uncultured Bilophila sp.]